MRKNLIKPNPRVVKSVQGKKPGADKPPSYDEIKREIAQDRIRPLYIIFSDDSYKVETLVNSIKDKVIEKGFESFDVNRFAPPYTQETVSPFLSLISTPPMVSKKRLIIFKDFGSLPEKLFKDTFGKIRQFSDEKNEKRTVVIISAEYDKESEEKLKKMGLGEKIIRFYKPWLENLRDNLRREVWSKGLNITDEALSLFLELSDNSYFVLQEELNKIALWFKTSPPATNKRMVITPEIIEELVSFSKEPTLFELGDATKKRERSLRIFVDLWVTKNLDPVAIVGYLAANFFDLLVAKSMKLPEIKNYFLKRGKKDYYVDKLLKDSQLWSREEISTALGELARIDKAIKTGFPSPRFLLESFFIKFVENHG